MYIVSACLAGVDCKYSGGNNFNEKIEKLVKEGKAVLVCPEQLGGLKTPRDPSEQQGDKVVTDKGIDVTNEYNKGAIETLKIAKMCGADTAILKSRSPSCGCGEIYDGTFSGTKIAGDGVTTKLLLENGIKVISSDDLDNINL
ncbi:MAG: DUF523 domain-containing protein [Clostridia bacterium]|nr:DUF523 domain-containing protein [Clostridia bacterium]